MRSLLIYVCVSSVILSSCSDVMTSEGDDSAVDKTFGSYYEDPYNDTYSVSDPDAYGDQSADGWYSEDEEALIDEFLNTWLGDPLEGDLTDGSTLVAGPALSPDVVLSCERGVVSVTHGVAVGALATALAASGLSLAGVGGTATIPASVPLYATAGGLIAFGLSGEAWSNCLFGLARLGFALMQNGYWSAARGVQNIVRSNRSGGALSRPSAPATTSTSTATAECRPHGEKCEAIKHRYKDVFCAGVEDIRDFLGINVHDHGVCDLGGLSCADLDELMRLASGCWIGRQTMTDRCYDGVADEGHRRATEYAKRDFNSCVRKFRALSCGDADSRRDAHQQSANESYPECR